MKVARRRFFGLAAAVPAVAQAKPPMAEMVEADIAPVPVPPSATWHWMGGNSPAIALIQEDLRARMFRLSKEIDAEVRKSLGYE